MPGDGSPIVKPVEVADHVDGGRRGAAAFVLVFAAIVLGLLAGYRYAIDTKANDWYLFQVARHTAWVLSFVGHEAALEKHAELGLQPAAVRAVLRGEAPQQRPSGAPPEGTGDAPPLTAWETWRYRALKNRDSDTRRETGPRITFVLRPGVQHQLAAREEALRQLQAAPPDAGIDVRQQALQAEISALREKLSTNLADPALRRERQGLSFTFIVIPECGAIEVMAIFLAAVIAFPAPWRKRVGGLALGVPLMYLVNIFRLACLACIGALDTEGAWFEFIHEYVWQAVYVIFVVLVWMVWAEFSARRKA